MNPAILIPIFQQVGAPVLKSILQRYGKGKATKVAAEVIDVLAGKIGTERTPEAIAEAHRTEPARVETIIREVEQDSGKYLALLTIDAQSDDKWQSRWRPFNGYLFGLACFITIITVCIVVGFQIPLTENALTLAAIISPTIVSWATVVGVYVRSRSNEKIANAQ